MIVKMKRLEILLYHRERDLFLDGLKKLGVVHIVEEQQVGEAHDVQMSIAEVRRTEWVISRLAKLGKDAPSAGSTASSAQHLLDRFDEVEDRIETCTQEIAAIEKDCRLLEPWGDFDRASIEALERAGVHLRFFIAPEKAFETIDRNAVTIEVVATINRQVFFVVVEHAGAPAALPFEEVPLPDRSRADCKKALYEKQQTLSSLQAELGMLSGSVSLLESYLLELKEQSAYKRVILSMPQEVDGKVLMLRGWVPITSEKQVRVFLNGYTVWYAITEPALQDAVPILVKNGPFARLFEPLLKIYDLPDYFEFDPTPFFAPFFMLFVGLCLGDVAYGSILAITGTIVAFKASRAIRPFAFLIIVLGLSTMFAGVLLNSFFGHTIFGGPGIAEGSAYLKGGAALLSPLCPIETAKGQVFPMMSFALVIGMLQLFVAMILKGINQILQGNVQGSLQPFASFLMVLSTFMLAADAKMLSMDTLAIGPLHVGKLLTAFPASVMIYPLILSFVLFFFFNNLQLRIFFRPLMGLWEFYQFASGIVTYMLSYIRLFALGLSGGLLGAAFNYIAFMFITNDGQVTYASPMIVVTIVVLIVGHTINLALSMIGSFVHPLRLTFVEFYSTLGFRGGGKQYVPFKQLKTVEKSQ